jgi:hypothetical protein
MNLPRIILLVSLTRAMMQQLSDVVTISIVVLVYSSDEYVTDMVEKIEKLRIGR